MTEVSASATDSAWPIPTADAFADTVSASMAACPSRPADRMK
jgi:hypothetical protein